MAALTNDVWTKLGKAKDNLVGPSYSYTDRVPPPQALGIGEDGNFGQIFRNVNGAFAYTGIMGYADKPLGDSYLVDTAGMCVSPSGKLQKRMAMISNIPEPGILGQGLVGGAAGDVLAMDPTLLFKAIAGDPTPACQKYKCAVTNQMNGTTGYMAPSMTPDMKKGGCVLIPEPDNPDDAQAQTIKSLQTRVNELRKLRTENPNIKSYKTELAKKESELEDAQTELAGMADGRAKYAELTKEGFEMMNTPGIGGLGLAALLIAVLVFTRARM
jgi:hypothetical protein